MTDTTRTQDAPAVAETQGGCGCGGCGCGAGGGEADTAQGLTIVAAPDVRPGDLDLRALPRTERHTRVLDAVGALLPGEALVLANDHDPQGLRAELEANEVGHLTWTYLLQGPDVWRVQISRESCC